MTLVKTTFGRRAFIRNTGLASGGLVLGFSWLASCKDEAAMEAALQMPDSWFDINGFLKIGDNGLVTIMSPNPEIGQNVKTAMPMIVADELDVDWANVLVEQAPLNTDIFTRQLAGGSQSIRQGWQGLRLAGATARQMLKQAAANAWQVPVGEIVTAAGMISHKASGNSAGYGEMAAAAGALEVPGEVVLKEPGEFSIIGTDRKNVDGKKIITGQPLFGLDVDRDNMRIAMVVHPPAFGQKFKSANLDEIKAMPGIQDAFHQVVYPEGAELQWSDGGHVSEMLVIVGNSTWEVMQAKRAVQAEWEADGPLESTEYHNSELAKLLEQAPDNPGRRDGNPEAAFARAATIVEKTYSAPYLAHNTMEPMNFFAHVTADKAELLGPIQTPEYLENTLAGILEMPKENIDIMMTRMGGGFGRRLYGSFAVEAAVISKRIQSPVKVVYSREDDMTQGTYRPSYMVRYRAGLDADGKLIAWHMRAAGTNDGGYFANRFPAGAVENYLSEGHTLRTEVTTGAWRAPTSNFMAGVENAFLDEVAEAAGKDPIAFRLELFDRSINDPVGDPEKNDYDPERYAGVLRHVRDKSNWDSSSPNAEKRGVAAYYCHNSYVAQVLDVEMNAGVPRADKIWCAVDCGIVINPLSARNQIEGGIVDGIGHATFSAITFEDGKPQQDNFDSYRLIRHSEAPREIETFFVDNGIDPTGLGEPSLPPVMGALANAMYRKAGKRYYHQPFVGSQEDRRIIG